MFISDHIVVLIFPLKNYMVALTAVTACIADHVLDTRFLKVGFAVCFRVTAVVRICTVIPTVPIV